MDDSTTLTFECKTSCLERGLCLCVLLGPKPSIAGPMLSQISTLFIFLSLCAINDSLLASLIRDARHLDTIRIYDLMLETKRQSKHVNSERLLGYTTSYRTFGFLLIDQLPVT